MAYKTTAAFRCRACGHLEAAEHAGERQVPGACSACGEGVKYDRRGTRTFDQSNWEVLADATPERLEELELATHTVSRHSPLKPGEVREPKQLSVHASEVVASVDASR